MDEKWCEYCKCNYAEIYDNETQKHFCIDCFLTLKNVKHQYTSYYYEIPKGNWIGNDDTITEKEVCEILKDNGEFDFKILENN